MKIAYDAQIFLEQKYGGASRYFSELASHISKLKDVDVLITAPMHINAYLKGLSPQIVSGLMLPRASRLPLFIRGAGMLVGDLMLRMNSPDIIHETYFFPLRLGPCRARRVLTIHDMIHEKFKSFFSAHDRTSKFKLMAAKRADHIICVSESSKTDLVDTFNINPDKVSVVYNGFGLLLNTCVNDEPNPINEPFILYVGSRKGYKNFSGLLDAYGSSSWLRRYCKLVCFGGGHFSREELEAIGKMGLYYGNIVQISGDDYLLRILYKRARAFVYPSLYEGFGIPPLEAMSFDCPVICSNTGSIPEVVGEAGVYFDPYSVDDMRQAIEQVVGSDSDRKKIINNGRSRLKLFSWERCAQETANIYRKLV